jgi:hypothetical protein
MIHRWGAAAVLVLACAGCASGERSTVSSEVADRFLASVGSGDAATACELLAPTTLTDLESGEGQPCADSLGSLGLPGGGSVEEVEVWGDRALATASTDTLFLVELDTGWRVAAAGCASSDGESYDCLLSGA